MRHYERLCVAPLRAPYERLWNCRGIKTLLALEKARLERPWGEMSAFMELLLVVSYFHFSFHDVHQPCIPNSIVGKSLFRLQRL